MFSKGRFGARIRVTGTTFNAKTINTSWISIGDLAGRGRQGKARHAAHRTPNILPTHPQPCETDTQKATRYWQISLSLSLSLSLSSARFHKFVFSAKTLYFLILAQQFARRIVRRLQGGNSWRFFIIMAANVREKDLDHEAPTPKYSHRP